MDSTKLGIDTGGGAWRKESQSKSIVPSMPPTATEAVTITITVTFVMLRAIRQEYCHRRHRQVCALDKAEKPIISPRE